MLSVGLTYPAPAFTSVACKKERTHGTSVNIQWMPPIRYSQRCSAFLHSTLHKGVVHLFLLTCRQWDIHNVRSLPLRRLSALHTYDWPHVHINATA